MCLVTPTFGLIHTMRCLVSPTPVAYFTKEVNMRLAKCPLVFNGHLASRSLTFLVKGATSVIPPMVNTMDLPEHWSR